MTPTSGQTTGNVPVEAVDPGGTRPGPSGNASKSGTSDLKNARPEVQSGDRNEGVGHRDDSAGKGDRALPPAGAPS